MAIVIRSARESDLTAIERLLQRVGLITTGVAGHLRGFQVAEEGGEIVGTAGLEVYGRSALLRSVAVDPAYRDRRIARDLVTRLLNHAAAIPVDEVFLLTTGAADYFRRHGFEPVARDAVPSEVAASAEFGDAACATAQAMRIPVMARTDGKMGRETR